MKSKSILIILSARDFNEIEFNIVKFKLEKRGYNLFIASDTYFLCIGNNGAKVSPDIKFFNIHESNFSAIIFIGGIGTKEYFNNKLLHSVIHKFNNSTKLIAAICSSVIIIAKTGIMLNKKGVCYPENKNEFEKEGGLYIDQEVILDGNILTARDPNSASLFADNIIHYLEKI